MAREAMLLRYSDWTCGSQLQAAQVPESTGGEQEHAHCLQFSHHWELAGRAVALACHQEGQTMQEAVQIDEQLAVGLEEVALSAQEPCPLLAEAVEGQQPATLSAAWLAQTQTAAVDALPAAAP